MAIFRQVGKVGCSDRTYHLLMVFLICGWTVTVVSGKNEKDLVTDLLGSYGPNSVRPLQNASQAISVSLRLLVALIIEFDEPRQQLTIKGWQRTSWRDEFLVWNPGDYNGQTELRTLRPNIWKPNLVVLENVNSNFAVHDNTEISITSNGTVNWYAPVIYQTACKVNVRQFPFDVQHCNLSFLSWTFDQSRLELWYFDDEDAKQEVFSGDGVWHLVDVAAERKDVFWACCEQPFSIVVYTLTFERSSLFYTFSILIPSVLLTTITLALFWMPAESGEKISLGMTNLLAFVLFQQLIADSMPPLGDQIPIITIYLFCMVVVGCASIYVAVYVLRLYHTPSDKPVPQGVVNVVKCLSRQKAPVTWQAVSRIIDKGMFAVFLVSSVVIMVTSFIAVKHGA